MDEGLAATLNFEQSKKIKRLQFNVAVISDKLNTNVKGKTKNGK